MKSLGPDAYIDREHPKEPPAHISKAIGEALGDLNIPGPSPKPPPGAAMPNKTPPPERSSNGAPASPGPRDTPAPPPRSLGRPRSNRIDSFNTDSFLRQNRKFIKLKRLLKINEEKTWTIITSMFCYVAQSQALTPKIDDIDLFAEFCYWQDDPQILIDALISTNFLTETLGIPAWFQNQPHAARKLHDYKYYQKQKQEDDELSDDFREFPHGNSRKLGSESDQKQSKSKSKSKSKARTEKRPQNVDNSTENHEKPNLTLTNTINDLTETLKIHKGSKDYDAVNDCIHRLHYNSGDDATIRIVSKIKEQFIAGEIKKPVAYVIGTVNKELESLVPERNSSANQKPTPVCPKCNHLILSSFGKCDWCDYVIPDSKPDLYPKPKDHAK